MIIYILFLHFVADFCLQTSWMANNKSSNNVALLWHVVVYSFCLFLGILVINTFIVIDISRFVLLNMVLHFITDYATSRFNKILLSKKNYRGFFAMIGFDQLVHTITLLLTLQLVLGAKCQLISFN